MLLLTFDICTIEIRLPDGWEARKTTEGRIYYIDNNNKRTQWEHPKINDIGKFLAKLQCNP